MDQATALAALRTGQNVYLTGPAGTGKTYVLNAYLSELRKAGKKVGVTAPTGLAASHLNGHTIHSWAGIQVDRYLSDQEIKRRARSGSELENRLQQSSVLVIDEVSMLHGYRLDLVDQVCRVVREDKRPFGGLQVILCGDFFQLPPIKERGEEAQLGLDLFEVPPSDLAVHAGAWAQLELLMCYLTTPYRQEDGAFLEILSAIRANQMSDAVRTRLQARLHQPVEGLAKPTRLFTHNRDVDHINDEELANLPGKGKRFTMVENGPAKYLKTLKKSALAREELVLKEGALVMFIRNNATLGYVNGTLGEVTGFDADGWPIVHTLLGRDIVAAPETWSIRDDVKTIAGISQIPLRLAWAITVHKSQGMSLDAADMDLSRSFEPGMGYVALSRVRMLEGITLRGLNEQALRVSEEAVALDHAFRKASEATVQMLQKLAPK